MMKPTLWRGKFLDSCVRSGDWYDPMRRLILFIFALCLCASAQTWSKWNGVTVGSTTGNVGKWNGITIGTTAGNIGKWNGLTSPGGSATLSEDTIAATPNCITGTTTCTIASATLTAGHLYVLMEASTTVGATHTPTNETGVTWNAFTGSCHTDAGSKIDTCWWWTIPSSTYSGNITITDSPNTFYFSAAILGCQSSTGWPASPVDIAGAISDNENFTTTSGVNYTMSAGTTGTTAKAVEWIIGGLDIKYGGVPGTPTWGAAGVFTLRANNVGNTNSPGIMLEDYVSTSSSTFQAQSTINMSSGEAGNYGVGVTLAMKPN